jgi:uncharacterized protein YccT (UPF0319 family)
MKYKLLVFIVLYVGFMASAVSSELSIPKAFEFLAVDGKDVGGWINTPRSIDLSSGEHKIALKYTAAVEDAGNPRIEEFIGSEPILVTLMVEDGKNYHLVAHSSIKYAPREFAENPRVKVVSNDGGNVNADVSRLVQNDQSKWAKVTGSYESSTKPQISDMAKITAKSTAPALSANGSPASSMLVYWWNQADQQTRDNFLKQINQ